MCKTTLAVLATVLLVLMASPSALAQSAPDQRDSCRKFVQEFHEWYTPIGEKNSHSRRVSGVSAAEPAFHTDSADQIVIEQKAHLLSPALRKALQEDRHAQAKNPARNVSLDIDPFTGVQDFENADSYRAGTPDRMKEVWSVPVHEVHNGVRSRRAVLWLRVRSTSDRWVIADVIYDNPDLCGGVDTGCNLLQLLKSNEGYRSTLPRNE